MNADLTIDAVVYITILSVILVSFGLVCWLKGKYWLAVLCPLPGAIRLARPESWWAKQFYANFPDKMDKATVRYAGRRASNKWLAIAYFILISAIGILMDTTWFQEITGQVESSATEAGAPSTDEGIAAPEQEEQAPEATDVPDQEQTPEATPEPAYPKALPVALTPRALPGENTSDYLARNDLAGPPGKNNIEFEPNKPLSAIYPFQQPVPGDKDYDEDYEAIISRRGGRVQDCGTEIRMFRRGVFVGYELILDSDVTLPTFSQPAPAPVEEAPAVDTPRPAPSGANVGPVATPTPANAFLPAKSSSPNASKVSGWSTDHLMKRRAELVQRFKDDSFGIYVGVMRWVSHALDKGKAKEEFLAISNELNRRGIRVSTEIPKEGD